MRGESAVRLHPVASLGRLIRHFLERKKLAFDFWVNLGSNPFFAYIFILSNGFSKEIVTLILNLIIYLPQFKKTLQLLSSKFDTAIAINFLRKKYLFPQPASKLAEFSAVWQQCHYPPPHPVKASNRVILTAIAI